MRTYDKNTQTGGEQRREVTIKFGKGLVDEPFMSKSGKEMVRISIPNRDSADRRPWETFVMRSSMVHDNQYGKGVWMKLPEDGTTKLSRSVLQGQDDKGKNIWVTESRTVSNTELKSMMEAYKEKSRDSVLSDLDGKKTQVADTARSAPRTPSRSRDAEAR